ncbi:MAG: ABC transporter permease [Candidatus Hodarchaeota archaeon]
MSVNRHIIFKTNDDIILKPSRFIDLKELWRYRELLITFTWRDLKVKYKQTILRILWAFIPPFLSMIVFTIIFGEFLKVPSEGIPYPLFVYTGTLIWNFFSTSLNNSSASLVSHGSMINKIYFPRLVLPLSSVLSGLVDFFIAFGILVLLMFYFQIFPSVIGIIILPVLLFITVLSALGIGLFLAALNVRYRDVKFMLPFFIQLGFFVTPVVYPTQILEEWAFILWLNPMTCVIETIRSGLLGTGAINWEFLILSLILSLIYFAVGMFYFQMSEKEFADIM